MMKRLALLIMVIVAATALSYPAAASLIPMAWGFPVAVQNASLTGLQTSTQSATDLESATIGFPATGFFGTAFPTIGQNTLQTLLGTNLGFTQQTQSSVFAYPYLSIGGAPVPGMGFI